MELSFTLDLRIAITIGIIIINGIIASYCFTIFTGYNLDKNKYIIK